MGNIAQRAQLAVAAKVVGSTAACSAALAWGTAGPLAAVLSPGPADFDAALALTVATAAWGVLLWLVAGTTLSVVVSLRGRRGGGLDRLAAAIAPAVVRRLAALLLGAGLVGAPTLLAVPAQADVVAATVAGAGWEPAGRAGPPPVVAGASSPAATVKATGWTPDRPAAEPKRQTGTGAVALVTGAPRPERAAAETVVVRRGDTLWDLAARHLGPDATAADVAAEWPRWHAANRSTIGPDPGLITPGQQLHPPAP